MHTQTGILYTKAPIDFEDHRFAKAPKVVTFYIKAEDNGSPIRHNDMTDVSITVKDLNDNRYFTIFVVRIFYSWFPFALINAISECEFELSKVAAEYLPTL